MSYITPFWGELNALPVPLEWSMNYCSHACAYCFANLNSPTRKGDANAALRQVSAVGTRATYLDLLLDKGFPVCISNRVDAFSESNYRECLPVMQAMKEQGIPIYFQTKFGKGVDEVLDGLPPSVFYVTIAHDDEKLAKKIEPGAPLLGERYDRIAQVIEAGHKVIVASSPWVPGWIKNPEAFMRKLHGLGVHAYTSGRLHHNAKQLVYMPEAGRKAMTEEVIQFGMSKDMTDAQIAEREELRQLSEAFGIPFYVYGYPYPTKWFEIFESCYPCFPVTSDFINWCSSMGLGTGDIISFDEFWRVMSHNLPEGKLRIGDYVRATNYHVVERIENWSDYMTFEQFYRLLWSDARIKGSPAKLKCFAYACERESNGDLTQLTDDNGMPYLIYDAKAQFSEFLVEYTGDDLE